MSFERILNTDNIYKVLKDCIGKEVIFILSSQFSTDCILDTHKKCVI